MFSTTQMVKVVDDGPYSFPEQQVQLYIRRLDLIDPVYGGNKWFKLKHNLLKAKQKGFTKVVSFGGAWSNHIAALARAGKINGFETVGIIRGESTSINNKTLTMSTLNGMKLIFCDREKYRHKDESNFLSEFLPNHYEYFIIPEGGSNYEGMLGCAEIINDTDHIFDVVSLSCGTGTTAAGILTSLQPNQQLLGFSVLKDGGSLEENILRLSGNKIRAQWKIEHDFHFGGYAKNNSELLSFVEDFRIKYNIPIEPVYTGKMFFGLHTLIHSGYFKKDTKILAIHTGGLQYL